MVYVNLKSKPDWLFERNPFGLVPILEHRGNVVYESAVCNEFLEEAFPGSNTGTHDLLPSCLYRRAAARLMMFKIDKVCMLLTFIVANIIAAELYHHQKIDFEKIYFKNFVI